ncbi:UNVERIFIED_CONTAM: hypothetical protein FKN15_058947 [Acipenser sinensis]
MGKDPNKPRGKMSSYAYFVQTCREEHKKKHPDTSVNFSEFSNLFIYFFRSAFFVFCSEHRPKIKADYPGSSIGDTAKKLGEMWSKLTAKDKVPFEQKALKLKEKYEKDKCGAVFDQ